MPGVEPGALPPGRAEAEVAPGDGHRPHTAPFQAGTDPGLLWRGRRHQEILDQLTSGVRDQGGVLLLTGDVGTGKTILAKALLDRLRADTLVARVVYARPDPLDFSKEIGEAWGVGDSAATRETFYAHLPKFLDDAAARGKRVLLFVDEAQTLSQDLFAEIGRLAIVAGESRPGHAGLSILLVGQDALKAILARPENAALAKRITVRCMTAPLTSAEVREYVAHQLTVTGARPPVFTEDGLQEIATASQGIPRLINTIADLAVLNSVQRRAPTVDAEAVRQSARMLGHPLGHTGRTRPGRARARRRTAPGRRGPARRSALYISILVVLLASGGYLYISGAARDRDAPRAPRTNTLPVALPVAPAFSDRPVSEGVTETMPFAQATEAVPSGLPTPKPWRPEGPASPTRSGRGPSPGRSHHGRFPSPPHRRCHGFRNRPAHRRRPHLGRRSPSPPTGRQRLRPGPSRWSHHGRLPSPPHRRCHGFRNRPAHRRRLHLGRRSPSPPTGRRGLRPGPSRWNHHGRLPSPSHRRCHGLRNRPAYRRRPPPPHARGRPGAAGSPTRSTRTASSTGC